MPGVWLLAGCCASGFWLADLGGRGTNHKVSWRHDVRFVDGLFLDEVERHVRGFAGHAYWILANRGQADVVGVEAVVIADKRYIARHGETVALQLEHERQSMPSSWQAMAVGSLGRLISWVTTSLIW